jgi:hypothetical protein
MPQYFNIMYPAITIFYVMEMKGGDVRCLMGRVSGRWEINEMNM